MSPSKSLACDQQCSPPRRQRLLKEGQRGRELKIDEESTDLELRSDRYMFQAIPQDDWNGTRYWIGINLKLIPWIKGQTFQLAMSAAIEFFKASAHSLWLVDDTDARGIDEGCRTKITGQLSGRGLKR